MTRNGKKSNKTLSSVEYPPKRVIRAKTCFIEFKCTNELNYVLVLLIVSVWGIHLILSFNSC